MQQGNCVLQGNLQMYHMSLGSISPSQAIN